MGVGAGPPPIGGLGNFPQSLGNELFRTVSFAPSSVASQKMFAADRGGVADAVTHLDLRPHTG